MLPKPWRGFRRCTVFPSPRYRPGSRGAWGETWPRAHQYRWIVRILDKGVHDDGVSLHLPTRSTGPWSTHLQPVRPRYSRAETPGFEGRTVQNYKTRLRIL